jgi:hypothetical protein
MYMERRSQRLRRRLARPRSGGRPPGRNGRGGDRGDGRSGGRGDGGQNDARGAGVPEPEHSRGQLVVAVLILPLALFAIPLVLLLLKALTGNLPD